MLTEEAFHTKVSVWLGIAGEAREGKHTYLFGGMVPQLLPGEDALADSRKRLVEEELQPIIKRVETQTHSIKETMDHSQHWSLDKFIPYFY